MQGHTVLLPIHHHMVVALTDLPLMEATTQHHHHHLPTVAPHHITTQLHHMTLELHQLLQVVVATITLHQLQEATAPQRHQTFQPLPHQTF